MAWMEKNKIYHTGQHCREYGTPDWQSAPLIHFAHYACRPRKRSECMAEFMASKGTHAKLTKGMCDPTKLEVQLSESIRVINVVKHHVDALSEYCKKDSFAKGRVRKALKAAKIIA